MSTALSELRQMNIRGQRAARGETPDGEPLPQPTEQEPPSTPAPEVARTTSSAVAQITSSAVALPTEIDPIKAAYTASLSQPIPPTPDGTKPQMVVTTIKIRQEVWEKMKHAVYLTGKNQQELVDEALRDMFAKITQGEQ